MGFNALSARAQMNHLRQTINKDNNRIIAMGCTWQLDNKVKAYAFPATARDWQWLQQTSGQLVAGLVELTRTAMRHMPSNIAG